jgi:hypothetical protein
MLVTCLLTQWPVITQLSIERRFEHATLKFIAPIFLLYIVLLAMMPFPIIFDNWTFCFALSDLIRPSSKKIFGLLEYSTAFTVGGFMFAEALGRKRTPDKKKLTWVFLAGLVTSCYLEVSKGFIAANCASLINSLITSGSALIGGFLYYNQLKTLQEWRQSR